jgi:hypothetical protein
MSVTGSIPKISMRAALEERHLLGAELSGDSWKSWRVLLLAAMGEPLRTDDELKIFHRLTNRSRVPTQRVEEFWGVIGRRGGKSKAMGALAVYIAVLCDHRAVLSAGETATVLIIAPDQRQAKITLDYVAGYLDASPVLRQVVKRQTADSLELDDRVVIEVRASSFRRLRGLTCAAIICDEAAYWLPDDTSANPDTEILTACRPMLATTGGPLIVISSPYGRRGELWEVFKSHFGAAGDPRILVAQGESRALNPELSEEFVARQVERDPAAAAAEYFAQFRVDVLGFLSIEVVRRCTDPVRERVPERRWNYVAFTDVSGGSSDSYALAIGHLEGRNAVIDCVRERTSPFPPEQVTEEYCALMRTYGIWTVVGDRFGGEWPREVFRRFGITYEPCVRNKSDLYIDLLAAMNSETVALVEHDRLQRQLISLERRTARAGRDIVDHQRGAKDDVANAVAGVVWLAQTQGIGPAAHRLQPHAIDSFSEERRRDGDNGYFSGPGWAATWHGNEEAALAPEAVDIRERR